RRRHTRCDRDWSSDVCSSDLGGGLTAQGAAGESHASLSPNESTHSIPGRAVYLRNRDAVTRPEWRSMPISVPVRLAACLSLRWRSEERRVGSEVGVRGGTGV